jgi:activator of HSP90 ATPase
MTRPIQQSVILGASSDELFDTFLDSRKHSALTEAPAKIGKTDGAKFTAFDGQVRGRNLLIVPKQLIVQAWRSVNWHANDPDSVLILQFSRATGGGRIDLVHVNVPAHDHKGVSKGWATYYWRPWKAYIAKQRTAPPTLRKVL